MGLWHTNESPNLGQKTWPNKNQQEKKRTCQTIADHRIKLKENEKKDKYLDLAKELKKTMEQVGDNYINRDWCFWYSHQIFIKETGGFGNRRTSGDHTNFNIIMNGQNTETSCGDFKGLLSLKLQWIIIS